MLSQCLWCKKGTATDADIILCFGCEKSYHGNCVSLSRTSIKLIKETAGVKWYCMNCDTASFADMISQRLNTLEGKVDVLSSNDSSDTKFDVLLKRIDSMTTEVSNIKDFDQNMPLLVTPCPLGPEADEVFRPRKRLRSGYPKESSTYSIWPSIPSNCIRGTDDSSKLKVIEPKLWYHV